MKCYLPAGDWHWIDKASNKVAMTYLLQNWDYSGEILGNVKHICPWGMKDTMTFLLSDKKCKNKPVLPYIIKDLTTDKPYNKDLMTISVTNTGPHAAREYYRLSCQTCESDPELLKAILQKHQDVLRPNPNIFTLIWNFDSLKVNTDKIDFVGCFLLWHTDVEAGPNARSFLKEPSEHIDICHLYTKVSSTAANKRKSQTKLIGPSPSKKEQTLSLNVDKSNKQYTLQNSLRASQKSFQQGEMDDYNTKIKLIGDCKNQRKIFAKGVCLSVVHTVVNKMLSNAAIIDNYKFNLKSFQEYHKFSEELIGNMIPPTLGSSIIKK